MSPRRFNSIFNNKNISNNVNKRSNITILKPITIPEFKLLPHIDKLHIPIVRIGSNKNNRKYQSFTVLVPWVHICEKISKYTYGYDDTVIKYRFTLGIDHSDVVDYIKEVEQRVENELRRIPKYKNYEWQSCIFRETKNKAYIHSSHRIESKTNCFPFKYNNTYLNEKSIQTISKQTYNVKLCFSHIRVDENNCQCGFALKIKEINNIS